MSIDDRKDVRCKIAPAAHSALTILAKAAGKELGEYASDVLAVHIEAEVTKAKLLVERLTRGGK